MEMSLGEGSHMGRRGWSSEALPIHPVIELG